eukprot:scaffold35780_cov80-Skeletonema_marinoi.AAC.3
MARLGNSTSLLCPGWQIREAAERRAVVSGGEPPALDAVSAAIPFYVHRNLFLAGAVVIIASGTIQ